MWRQTRLSVMEAAKAGDTPGDTRRSISAVCSLLKTLCCLWRWTIAALRQGLETILNLSSDEFKQLSHYGFVWIKRRPIDSGNWVYSLLFGWLLRARSPPDVVELLQALGTRYATLRKDHPTTSDSMGRRGDVLEVILAECRLTGPSIPKATRV